MDRITRILLDMDRPCWWMAYRAARNPVEAEEIHAFCQYRLFMFLRWHADEVDY